MLGVAGRAGWPVVLAPGRLAGLATPVVVALLLGACGGAATSPATFTTSATPAAASPSPTQTPIPTPAPTPFACPPTSDFCYERVELAGAVVPYTDRTGKEDIGEGIRSLPDHPLYLVGHAYTDFGRIREYHLGDTVRLRGQSYVIYRAEVDHCGDPITTWTTGNGPVFLQTSLEAGCGEILVVMAR